MTMLVAGISAGDRFIESVLAAAALRRAGDAGGSPIEVEVRSAQGVLNPLADAAIDSAGAVLLVGAGDLDTARFDRLRQIRVGIDEVLNDPAGVLRQGLADQPDTQPGTVRRIVAVTACPTGIAHTFMAAEGLTQAAEKLGYALRVETQGSVGAQDTLTAAEIAAADIVLIAADTQVDLARFAGKRVFESGAKKAITEAPALITRALAEARLRAGSEPAAGAAAPAAPRTGPYKHLMSGVSFMLPFVTAGGLLIALSFALGGIYAFDDAHKGTLAYALFQIGAKSAFVLMVPALAGYIAFSIAQRPGLAPGMIGGLVAANLGAGFLGGIAAGFIAGYGTEALNRAIRLPRNLEGLKPVLILPVLGTLLTGLVMVFVVGGPTAQLLAGLSAWLRGMQGSSAILLGLLIGGMMALDMGGPVNKAAYAFSTGLIASHIYTPMAAAMVAGMTPPLGIALATRLFPGRFSTLEREAGAAAGVLGLAFVTEGAIPFAAKDPLRVIPTLMLGSALAGAMSMAFGVELKVPHGGVFVLPIPGAVTHLAAYILALAAGTLATALALGLTRRADAPVPVA